MLMTVSRLVPQARCRSNAGVCGSRPEPSTDSRARLKSRECFMTAPRPTSPMRAPLRLYFSTRPLSPAVIMTCLLHWAAAATARANGLRVPPMIATLRGLSWIMHFSRGGTGCVVYTGPVYARRNGQATYASAAPHGIQTLVLTVPHHDRISPAPHPARTCGACTTRVADGGGQPLLHRHALHGHGVRRAAQPGGPRRRVRGR